jgi:hypothetical protein
MTHSNPSTKAARAPTKRWGRAGAVPEPAAREFLIFEENRGDDQWTLFDRTGNNVARSASFASEQGAENAARDASDAERWLDEGGGFSRKPAST